MKLNKSINAANINLIIVIHRLNCPHIRKVHIMFNIIILSFRCFPGMTKNQICNGRDQENCTFVGQEKKSILS